LRLGIFVIRYAVFAVRARRYRLAGANAQRVIDRRHKNLAIPDLAGAAPEVMTANSLAASSEIPRSRSAAWAEIHDLFGAAIDLGMALLPAVALHLGHGHAVDADGGKRLADLVQLEGFDDRLRTSFMIALIPV